MERTAGVGDVHPPPIDVVDDLCLNDHPQRTTQRPTNGETSNLHVMIRGYALFHRRRCSRDGQLARTSDLAAFDVSGHRFTVDGDENGDGRYPFALLIGV